jgi:hypothetical protein
MFVNKQTLNKFRWKFYKFETMMWERSKDFPTSTSYSRKNLYINISVTSVFAKYKLIISMIWDYNRKYSIKIYGKLNSFIGLNRKKDCLWMWNILDKETMKVIISN